MKTIEEAKGEYADKHAFRVPYNGSNEFYDKVDLRASEDGFMAGVKFAQKWIPVTEEPEVNEFGFTEELLTKDERKYILQKGYKNKKGQFSWCDNNFVTHWRPIEIL